MNDMKINEDGMFEVDMTEEEYTLVTDWLEKHEDDPNVQEIKKLSDSIEFDILEGRRRGLKDAVVEAAVDWRSGGMIAVAPLFEAIDKLVNHREKYDLNARYASLDHEFLASVEKEQDEWEKERDASLSKPSPSATY